MTPVVTEQVDSALTPPSTRKGIATVRWLFIRGIHLAIFSFSLFGAFLLRWDFSWVPDPGGRPDWLAEHFLPIFWFIVPMKFFVFQYFGLYRGWWRYVGMRDLIAALKATWVTTALFLVFVVMAIQYESLRNPFIILLSVPFALIGVAIGTGFAELPLSMPVKLGMIMLAGIVVNNAIVLVEYIEIMRERGSDIRAAVLEAARLRLRPILMTTLTTVLGLVPLILFGGDLFYGMASVIAFGLIAGTVFTLGFVPVLYTLLFGVSAKAPKPDAEAAAPS